MQQQQKLTLKLIYMIREAQSKPYTLTTISLNEYNNYNNYITNGKMLQRIEILSSHSLTDS